MFVELMDVGVLTPSEMFAIKVPELSTSSSFHDNVAPTFVADA